MESLASRAVLAVPDGYAAIPLGAAQPAVSLQVCVLVRLQSDPVGGSLVVLRQGLDAQVLLGCVTDARGLVRQWVELLIQDPSGFSQAASSCREAISNSILDERWQGHVRMLAEMDPSALLHAGWEETNPPPLFVDPSSGRCVHPQHSPDKPWALCRDRELLARKGLRDYATTLCRYLHVPALGDGSPFVPATPDTPPAAGTTALEQAIPDAAKFIPLNPWAGLMMVRPFSPVSLEGFVGILNGGTWAGLSHGRTPLWLGGAWDALSEQAAQTAAWQDGWLFLGRQGRSGRLVESLHLKLRLLLQAVEAVATAQRVLRRPLLNLSADSFRLDLAPPDRGLPFLWTARLALVDAGEAVALPIPTSDIRYYLPGRPGVSIYRPPAGVGVSGRAGVRIRQVLSESGGMLVLEGTLATQERLDGGRNDLVWLRLGVGGARLDLYGRAESQKALAGGEWRFRTIPQRFSEAQGRSLKSAEGVLLDGTFELVPLLSSPCDMYALAVLAVRLLLVNPQITLPVAVDEVVSLARQLAAECDASVGLGQRIKSLFDRDGRWAQQLGPHRLAGEVMTPQEAFELVPPMLWWDILGLVVRMFPGLGPDSACRDWSDAPSGGIHKVFDQPRHDLEDLVLRTRSLVVVDWRFNREIHSVVRAFLHSAPVVGVK